MLRVPEKKTLVLLSLPVVAFLCGLLDYGALAKSVYANSVLYIQAIILLGLTFAWFWLDAVGRKYLTSWRLRVFMVGLTVVALPYYLFRSRGFVAGWKALGVAWLVFVATMTAYRAAAWMNIVLA